MTNSDPLLPAPKSLAIGVMTVCDRFNDLVGTYERMMGVKLVIPRELLSDQVRFLHFVDRLNSRDIRYRESELKSMKAIAQWTLEVNAKLRNQPCPKVEL